MKNLFKFLFVLLLFVGVRVYASEAPTLTLEGIYDGGAKVSKQDGYYHVDGNYTSKIQVSNQDSDYCIAYYRYVYDDLREMYDYNYVSFFCDYNLLEERELSFRYSKVMVAIVKKSDYEEMYHQKNEEDAEELDYRDLEKYSTVEFEVKSSLDELVNNFKITLEGIKDSEGNSVNKTDGKYILEKNSIYHMYFKPSVMIPNFYVRYYSNNFDNTDTQSISGQYTFDNEYMIIDLNTSYLSFRGNLDLEISLCTNDEYGLYFTDKTYPVYTEDYDDEDDNPFFTVDFSYKNSNFLVDLDYSTLTLNNNYFNEDKPLVMNITPKNFSDENVSVTVEVKDEDGEEYETLYTKTVTLNNNESNIVELPYFVTDFNIDHFYSLYIRANGTEKTYWIELGSGIIYTNAFFSDTDILLGQTGTGGTSFGYGGDIDIDPHFTDKIYFGFKAKGLDDNRNYSFRVFEHSDDEFDWNNVESYDELYSGTLKGELLNNNILYIPTDYDKRVLFFRFYDDNGNVITNANYSTRPGYFNSTIMTYIAGDNTILNTSRKTQYFKDNEDHTLGVFFKGVDYDEDTTYRYYIEIEGIVQKGNITGHEINTGKVVTFTYDPDELPYGWVDGRAGICGDESDEYGLNVVRVTPEEFEKEKKNRIINFDSSIIEELNNRSDEKGKLLVDDEGNDVLKDINYTVEYYKDGELANSEVITESIPYFDESVQIDTTKVNLLNKYTGYKVSVTSFGSYVPGEFNYTIEDGGTLKIYYNKDSFDYRVEYYYENEIDNDLTYTGNELYETEITEYTAQTKLGYKFDRVECLPLTITEDVDTNVIKVYYVIDEEQTHALTYKVEYYKDNEKVEEKEYFGRVQILSNVINVDKDDINITNKYPGYKFDKLNYETMPDTIEDNGVIKVYYVIDSFNYRIEYYYENEIDNDLTVQSKVVYGSVIENYEDKIKEGYKFDKVEGLPLTVSENENNNVIKVYYVIDEEQTHALTYKVEYYKDNEKVEEKEYFGRVQILSNVINVDKGDINITNKYPGYKFDKLNYEAIPDTIEDDGVIKVYYVKDNFAYNVEYYFNGVIDEELTVEDVALYESVIDNYIDKVKSGYILDKVENKPLTISEKIDTNVIKVYYITDQDNSEEVSITGVKLNNDNNKVTVSWNKDEFAIGYRVLRSEKENGSFKTIYDSESIVTSYVDSSTTYGKTYYYKVVAYNKHKEKTSNVVYIKIKPNKVELSIKSAGTNNIKLNWLKVGTTGYEVYYSTDQKNWKKATIITKNNTLEYDVKKLKENKRYYFKVRAYKIVGKDKVYGSYSNVVTTKTAPKKPTLKVTLKDYNAMNVEMGETKGATLYRLEKSLDGVNYKLIEEFPVSGKVVSDEQEIGKTYYFRLKACNSDNRCSGWVKAELKQTTKTPGFSIKTSSKKVTITMSKVNGATGYQIYRATSKKGKYSKIKEFSSEVELLEYVNKTKKGKTYYYKVRSFALNELGNRVYSPYSKIKSIRSK